MLPRSVPVNTISWLCTHNAFNSEAEIGAGSHEAGGTNQNHSIVEQFDAGVQALMIDVHEDAGAPRVRHVGGIAARDLNYEALCELLVHLKGWLVQHTTEVVLLLMEVDAAPELIRDTFAGAGPVKPAPCWTNYDLRDCSTSTRPGRGRSSMDWWPRVSVSWSSARRTSASVTGLSGRVGDACRRLHHPPD